MPDLDDEDISVIQRATIALSQLSGVMEELADALREEGKETEQSMVFEGWRPDDPLYLDNLKVRGHITVPDDAVSTEAQKEAYPSSDEIRQLPDHIRSYIHDLETRCDPAGDLRRLDAERQKRRELEAEVERLEGALQEIDEGANHLAPGQLGDIAQDALNRAEDGGDVQDDALKHVAGLVRYQNGEVHLTDAYLASVCSAPRTPDEWYEAETFFPSRHDHDEAVSRLTCTECREILERGCAQ